ncbi:radical SAM protein [Patescibacteria group bacterium]|nr:radical SAM protein [Patescibacteria group bacterium]
MNIKEINVKSIIVKSNLPDGDFVINPYTGCSHGCIYCYARFMKRFSGHLEPWGEFVDVKINAPDLIPEDTGKYKNRSVTIGSVTDPYLPLESKYKLTRRILEKLIPLQPHLDIITKSDLVLRDIDLLKQFDDCIIGVSASFLDEEIKNKLEPNTISTKKRIEALKKLHEAGIETALFISPIFPEISDWQKLIDLTKGFTIEYWFENLNLYPSIRNNIYKFLQNFNPDLINKYKEIYSGKSDYWEIMERNIKKYCDKNKLDCRIYFHHKAMVSKDMKTG